MQDIIEKLKSEDEQTRIDGCVELAKSKVANRFEILKKVYQQDPSSKVRYSIRKIFEHVSRTQKKAQTGKSNIEGFNSEDPNVRVAAAQRVKELKDPKSADIIRQVLSEEKNPTVVATLISAIGALKQPQDVKLLASFLRHSDSRVRANVVESLLEINLPVSLSLVYPMLQDEDHRVRANAAKALAVEGKFGAMDILRRMAQSEKLWMRDAAAYALGCLDSESAVEILVELFNDRNRAVRDKAQKALDKFAQNGSVVAKRFIDGLSHEEPEPETIDEVTEEISDPLPGEYSLNDPNPKVRMNYINNIINKSDDSKLKEIENHLQKEENDFVISRIISAIGILGKKDPREHLNVLRAYLSHPDNRIVSNAIDAVTSLGVKQLVPQVKLHLNNTDARIRASAIIFLHNEPDLNLGKEVSALVHSQDVSMQRAASYVVEKLGQKKPGIISTLLPLLSSDNDEVYFDTFESLERMANKGISEAQMLVNSSGGVEIDDEVLAMPELKASAVQYNKRCFAFILDIFVLFGGGTLCAIIVGIFLLILHLIIDLEASQLAGNLSKSSFAIIALLYFLIYYTRDGFKQGRGFGKRWMGLRVVDLRTGEGCGYFRSLLRQATLGVPVIHLVESILVAADPSGRRLIDRLLGTQVVDEKQRELESAEQVLAVISSVIIGIVTVMLFIGMIITFFSGVLI